MASTEITPDRGLSEKLSREQNIRDLFLDFYKWSYSQLFKVIEHQYPSDKGGGQRAHEHALWFLGKIDHSSFLHQHLENFSAWLVNENPVIAGGVDLPSRLMLAAGWVKGIGFESEEMAVEAVRRGVNIIPGMKSMPQLMPKSPVMMGSYTPDTRLGNPRPRVWRDSKSGNIFNRVGIENPGSKAASIFMGMHAVELPKTYGINIAFDPAVMNIETQVNGMIYAVSNFLTNIPRDNWPKVLELVNTCPHSNDAGILKDNLDMLASVMHAVRNHMLSFSNRDYKLPQLWYKTAPAQSVEYYSSVVKICADNEVSAIVSTNTLPSSVPGNDGLRAGISGDSLFDYALNTAKTLHQLVGKAPIDVIVCGGINSRQRLEQVIGFGFKAGQFFSSLVYGGPWASAVIQR